MAGFTPNSEQAECIAQIYQFIGDKKAYSRFLINGSAGTGKTSILISSIINHFIAEIADNPTRYEYIVKNEKWEQLDELLEYFIISAPTNKAKDVLVSKYNAYLAGMSNDTLCERLILNEIVHRRIDFLTVSQVLSISRVINEMGEEEFTKGNEKKIAEKYNKPQFDKTIIIIDECSMIDSNTAKVLTVIKCPIIFIGDYCQLPPVGEDLSPIFQLENTANTSDGVSSDSGSGSASASGGAVATKTIEKNNTVVFRLSKVERCQQDVSEVANILRDKIYGVIPDFNLLKHKVDDIIQYPKRIEKWLDTYVDEIKEKLADIKKMQLSASSSTVSEPTSSAKPESSSSTTESKSKNTGNDSMALAWTNKCCAGLNQKVRNKLFLHYVISYDAEKDHDPDFENIEDINDHFLIKGDKLLVKVPYYKYGSNIYSSSIAYVAKLQKVRYKPLSFREWCNLAVSIKNADSQTKLQPLCDINIIGLLEDVSPPKQSKTPAKQKSVLDYFAPRTANSKEEDEETVKEETDVERAAKEQNELLKMRQIFFQFHNQSDVLTAGTFEFSDLVSLKYNDVCNNSAGTDNYNLMEIKKMPSIEEREKNYTKWHRKVSSILFGIPVERVLCRKCLFFINKFTSIMNKSCNIADMINATESLELVMFLTDLAVMTTTSSYINHDIPILDMLDKCNIDAIAKIRDIIKSSYEVKVPLTKQDLSELKTINKMLGEDDNGSKYITMSQMLGHYMSHVISSNYLEVDYGYAITVHKSQGSTYDDVFVEYGNLAANKKDCEKYKLLYTAITRSARKLHIYS